MAVQELDGLLKQWRQRLDTLSQALLKLHDLPSYRELSAQAQCSMLQQQLLQDIQQLFEQYEQLLEVVERAEALAQEGYGRLFGNKQQLALELLQSASLVVNQTSGEVAAIARASPTQADPLMLYHTTRLSRKLQPSAPATKITPEQLLKQFSTQYQQCFDQLQQWAEQEQRQVLQRREAIARAQTTYQQLPALFETVDQLQRDCQQKVTQSITQKSDAASIAVERMVERAEIESLCQAWLPLSHRLEGSVDHQLLGAVQHWQAQANALLERLEATRTCCQQQLSQRQELRGRLGALQAKAQARGQIETPSLVSLAFEAERLLYSRPTPLEKSQALVQQYEQCLNQVR